FLHAYTLAGRINTHHVGVRGQSTWPDAEHYPPPGEMIEEHHTVSQHQGMMVRQGTHAGSQTNMACPVGGGSNENPGRSDDLQTGRVMFADPGLVVAEFVKANNEFQIALQSQGRVLSGGMKRRHEDAEA